MPRALSDSETAMSFELPALVWLEAKHLRTELNFWLWAAGTDLDEARDVTERAYLAYLVVIVGVAVAACWLWILGLVIDAAQASSPEEAALLANAGPLAAGAALAFPATAVVVWSVCAAWRAPWAPSPPDVAWLTQQPVPIVSWSAIELAKRLVFRVIACTCGGYLVAAFALTATGEAPALPSCLPYAATLGVASSAAYAIAWLVGITRVHVGRERRPMLVIAALIGATGLICASAVSFPAAQEVALDLLRGNPMPLLAASAIFLVAVLSALLAARVLTPATLASEAATNPSLYTVRRMAIYNPKAYRALAKSRRDARRSPRIHLPRAQGSLAILARSSISFIRHIEALPALIATGAFIAPLGVTLLSGSLAQTSSAINLLGGETGARILGAASWILLTINSVDAPRMLARTFIVDMQNRFFREQLPLSTQKLFVFDVLPGFAVTAITSAIIGLCLGALGAPATDAAGFTLCAIALDAAFACIGALDAPVHSLRRSRVTCESATVIVAVVIAVISALVPAGATPLAFLAGTAAATGLAIAQLR